MAMWLATVVKIFC